MTDLTIILLARSTVPVHCGFGKNYDETMLELTRIIGYGQCIFKIKEGGEIISLNQKRLREPLRHSHQHIQLERREISERNIHINLILPLLDLLVVLVYRIAI